MKNHYALTPFFLDQPMPGLEPLIQPDWHINQPSLPKGSVQERMAALYQPLAEFVARTATHDERPVSLAGDCCTAIGVLAGLQRAGISPTLLWFDAHGDFNTWETSPSGFLGGMPLAMIVGRGEQTILDRLEMQPLPEAQVILIDARDLDPGERDAVETSQVTHLTKVDKLLDISLPDGPLYVHFDTDVVDPKDAPAMNYPTPGGPPLETIEAVFQRLAGGGRIVAASLSSWNPALDQDDRSQEVCTRLFYELIR
jgi:arginase